MKNLKLPMILAAVLAALALIAAGCGGDDEEASGPPLTKEEFITQADEICATGDEEINTAAEEQFGDLTEEPPVEDQEAFLTDVVAPNYEGQLSQIRELSPPEEDTEEIEAVLTSLDDLITQLQDDPAAVLEATEPPEASRLAQDYGLQNCGS